MASGAVTSANPDLVAHYLWSSAHGLVTLTLACKVEAPECGARDARETGVELFRSFVPFLRDGLSPRGSATVRPDDERE